MKEVLPVNSQIKSSRVVVIDSEGNKRGEFLRDDAIDMANQEGLDLVMVKKDSPPICKIMDYGRYLYQQKKKSKNNSRPQKIKEIKFSRVTDSHDLEFKINKAREFISKGHKVKITISHRKRGSAFSSDTIDKMNLFCESLDDIAKKDGELSTHYRYIMQVISPR